MAWYDLNNNVDSVAYGSLIARLWGFFIGGSFVGVWVGFAPFWFPHGWNIWNVDHAWTAFWWNVPIGIFGGIFYMAFRFTRDRKKTEAKEAIAVLKAAQPAPQQATIDTPASKPQSGFTGLLFGTSCGELYSRGHVGGVPTGEAIYAAKEDACKNTIVFGGIGSGKTTRAINPLLKQVFEQQCGALIFDIKADFSREVNYIAHLTGRSYIVVGHGGLTLNLIRGTTPELAASYLKSCFIASGSAGGSGAFFVDQAVELCRNSLTLLMLTGGDYSLAGLYEVVFSAEKREAALAEMLSRGEQYDKRQFRLAESVGNYFANVHGTFDEKMLSNVNATVAQVLSPFSHPDLIDAFSGGEAAGEADLTALLDGAIYLSLTATIEPPLTGI